MTPFAGEGANLALDDALKLADAIIAASRSITEGGDKKGVLSREVKKFEEDMFVRAKKVQQTTYNMQTLMFFTPGAPWTAIERYILEAASDEVPRLLWPVAVVVCYVYFFFVKLWKGLA